MAGPTVAKAEIDLDYDGSRLPGQASRLARLAGTVAGKEFAKSFDKQMGDVNKSLKKRLDESAKSVDRNTGAVKKLNSAWRRMDGTVKLVIGSILAGADQLAAFGPAIGAGLTVGLGAITALGLGLGVAVAGFIGLNGEIEDLGPNARKARVGLDSLGATLGSIRKEIQEVMTEGLDEAFFDMASGAAKLKGPLLTVARIVGDLIVDFGKWADSERTTARLSTVIQRMGGYFDSLVRSAGTFADAFITIFASSGFDRVMQEFLGWIRDLTTAFDEFANSPQLEVWFDRASRVFGSVGGVLDATAKALADLVNEDSISRLTGTLDTLADAMPKLGDLLAAIGEADVFGLLAEAIDGILTALDPVLPALGNLLGVIGDIVSVAIDQWAKDLAEIFGPLAPVIQAAADALGLMDEQQIRDIADALLALAAAAVILKGAQGIAGLPGKIKGLAGSMKLLTASIPLLGAVLLYIDSMLNEPEKWENGAKQIQGFWDDVVAAFENGGQQWIDSFTAVDEFMNEFFNEGGIITLLQDFRTGVNEFFYGLAEDAEIGVAQWRDSLIAAFANGWEQITVQFPTWLGGVALAIWTWLTTTLWPSIVTWWNEGWTNTVASFANGWEQIVTWFTTLQTSVNTWWNDTFWPAVLTWWNDGWANTAASFSNGWDQIVTWFTNLATSVSTWWSGTFWPGVVRWWNDGWARTARSFSNGWSQIVTWFTNLLTSVGNWWSNTFWPGVVRAWNSGWSSATSSFTSGWSLVSGWFGDLWASVSDWFGGFADMVARAFSNAVSGLTGGFSGSVSVSGGGGGGGGVASGGVAAFPMRRLIGEDGPEAIVPLDRPLSRVDPSVRWLSAIAQGQAGGGGGRGVVVEAGAVQVNGVLDPQRASLLVVNRLAERISG